MELASIKKDDLQNKLNRLQWIKAELKKEFFGIDEVIDKIIDLISSWYSMPSIQTKPMVINLWGMSGIGKTSLVERIVKLLNMEDKYFPFDLGDTDNIGGRFGLRSTLEEIYKVQGDNPIILSFDEFHYSRSINELSHEVSDTGSRMIWEILGSGKFTFTPSYSDIFELTRYVKFLKYQLFKEKEIKDGVLLNDTDKYEEEHERSGFIYNSICNGYSFFSSVYLETLFIIVDDKFNSQIELSDHLLNLSGEETVEFLQNSISRAAVKKTVDCSKALVFIIGNLDEAYTISGNFNPDISADIFYEETKKISLTTIKNVLRKRFRNEQIARLGNNHIIYPSLNSKAFYSIIENELLKIGIALKLKYGINLDFDETIRELIYKEGVFPTQGARPLHTTVDNIVGSNISRILYLGKMKNIEFDSVGLIYRDEKIKAEYYLKGIKKFEAELPLCLLTENRRKSKNDELQAIVAVHESGHAILMKSLLNVDPDGIISVSADEKAGGMTLAPSKQTKIISKKMIINENASNLGGFVAEKLVFGEENVSAGSVDDFERTTEFTSLMLKKAGLGKRVGSFELDQNFHLNFQSPEIEDEINELLKFAALKAEEVLKSNYRLLLKLSEYLSENSFMSKDQFLSYYEEHADFNYNSEDENFYRNILKEELSKVDQFQLKFTGTDD